MNKGAIIQRSETRWQAVDWRQQLQQAFRSLPELCKYLELDREIAKTAAAANNRWQIRVPQPFAACMEKGNPSDPLLLQVLPKAEELQQQDNFVADPLQESGQSPARGLIHKYRGRALLIAAGECAVHCRYCFRREFDYAKHRNARSEWRQALDYIRDDNSLTEVILSGGDPLLLDDAYLSSLCGAISDVAHVRRLRIHTRLPIVIPQRITQPLLDNLAALPLQVIMVVHCNHANELSTDVQQALRRVRQAGITLLNQSVLLAGVNNNADSLVQLSLRLFECDVLPYYLHLLDPVQGAAHFDCDSKIASALVAEASRELPGYLVPKLVREQAGLGAKQSIAVPI